MEEMMQMLLVGLLGLAMANDGEGSESTQEAPPPKLTPRIRIYVQRTSAVRQTTRQSFGSKLSQGLTATGFTIGDSDYILTDDLAPIDLGALPECMASTALPMAFVAQDAGSLVAIVWGADYADEAASVREYIEDEEGTLPADAFDTDPADIEVLTLDGDDAVDLLGDVLDLGSSVACALDGVF